MEKLSPFDFLNSINQTKENLMSDSDPLSEKDYNAFMVNRGLSYFMDTVFPANEMNMNHSLDKAMQYSFLLNIVAPRKRFSKWYKQEQQGDMEVVKEYYGYNNDKARAVLRILTPDQLSIIRERLFKGGKNEFRPSIS